MFKGESSFFNAAPQLEPALNHKFIEPQIPTKDNRIAISENNSFILNNGSLIQTSKVVTEDSLKYLLEEMIQKNVVMKYHCQSCGAPLDVEQNKPMIHCKYCGSAYVVGPARINSIY